MIESSPEYYKIKQAYYILSIEQYNFNQIFPYWITSFIVNIIIPVN